MKLKFISFLLPALFFISQTSIAKTQLTSYNEIRNHLLSGSDIKIISNADNDGCVLDPEDTPHSSNSFGVKINEFVIEYKNNKHGDIIIPISILNASDEKNSANFNNTEIFISSNNNVKIVTKGVSLKDYETFFTITTNCPIANESTNGIKFLLVGNG